jgi:pimeloyl-ACP methyl ester carboxylesterase
VSRFRVHALDLRGHGDSSWSPQRAYRLADYAADLAVALEVLVAETPERRQPILVGHSLGAFVALRFATEHPGSLAALVAVDSRANFGEAGSRYLRLLRALAPAEYPSLDAAVERFRLLPAETVACPEVLRRVARRSFRQVSPGRWIAKFDRETLAAHEPFDLRERLESIDCPVLFVRGSQSRVLRREGAARLAARCRRGASAEIPDAHHHVLLDRPAGLVAAIRHFLERHRLDRV